MTLFLCFFSFFVCVFFTQKWWNMLGSYILWKFWRNDLLFSRPTLKIWKCRVHWMPLKVCEIDFLSESDMPMILSMTLRITTWIASDLGWLSLSVNYNHSRAITWHLRTFMHHMGSELKLSRWVIYQVGSFSFEAEWVLKVGGKWVNPGFRRVGTMLCHCVCSGISVRVLIHLISFECWDVWCSLTVQLACKPLGTMVTGTSWRGRRVPRWRWIRPLSCAPMR